MVSIGDGLRMMQGGVDRTGYADMADAIGNPGLDLIRQRRQAAADEAALEALLASYDSGDSEDSKIEDKTISGDIEFSFNDLFDSTKDYVEDNPLTAGIDTATGLGLLGLVPKTTRAVASKALNFLLPIEAGIANVNEQVGNIEELKNDPTVDPEFTEFYEDNVLSGGTGLAGGRYSKGITLGNIIKNSLGFEDGGRVHLQGGGMDAGAGSLSGDRGFGAGVSRGVQDRMDRDRGGNKQGKINIPDKEVDIDQLKGDPLSMPSVSNYMGMTNTDPKMMYGIGSNLIKAQPPASPVDETSAFDQFSKYNPFAQTFDVAPGLTFGYDIEPNLKDLSDLSAEAKLTYSFNQGGNVSGKISDDEKSLRLSDEDKFIQAQTVGDTDLYDYLIGGEITPGLNFELGLMDDEITDPLGMTPREDYKFFRLIKEF